MEDGELRLDEEARDGALTRNGFPKVRAVTVPPRLAGKLVEKRREPVGELELDSRPYRCCCCSCKRSWSCFRRMCESVSADIGSSSTTRSTACVFELSGGYFGGDCGCCCR